MKKFTLIFLYFVFFAPVWMQAQTAMAPSGTGTSSDPYQIATLNNLYWITQNSSSWDKYFIQISDIDASATSEWDDAKGFLPIGNDYKTCFMGSYDGKGHIIDGLFIKRPSTKCVGLFGKAGRDAVIKNIGVIHVKIEGGDNTGGLVGYNSGHVSGSYSTGKVIGDVNVGGLVGLDKPGWVYDAYSKASVKGSSCVGGLIGSMRGLPQHPEHLVKRTYSTGKVEVKKKAWWQFFFTPLSGGLIGGLGNTESLQKVQDMGTDTLKDVAINSDWVASSFWDTLTSGQKTSAGGIGETTANMQSERIFTDAGWDFVGETANGTNDIWAIDSKYNRGYPFLSWQYATGAAIAVQPLGKGTSSDPYRIETLYNLYWITQNSSSWDKYFIQTSDIDASITSKWDDGKGFFPIGNDGRNFTGSYDGKGHTIDGLYINRGARNYVGLFGFVGPGASIENVGMLNVQITGNQYVGGLIGFNSGNVLKSYSKGQVIGGDNTGGLVGYNQGPIKNVYTTCSVAGGKNVGGLAGVNKGVVFYSYSTGKVTGKEGCGGLIGISDQMSVVSSFWDVETSGIKSSAGGIGKTTAEMQTMQTFTNLGFDFQVETIDGLNDIWGISSKYNNGYPFLSWQGYVITSPPQGKGTSSDPYRIVTLYNLSWITQNPESWDKYFVQTSDININVAVDSSWDNGKGFLPIGNKTKKFTGSYDGDGHIIDNLYINRSSTNYVGLFGYVGSGATIKNVGVSHVRVNGHDFTGSLIGYNEGGNIFGSYSTGQVVGYSHVGGFAGDNHKGNISISYSDCQVTGKEYVGGFAGYNGLSAIIKDVYSIGKVTVKDGYTTGGGLIDKNNGAVVSSFWDIQTSGKRTSAGGIGETTANMQSKHTFTDAGWDFVGETANGTNDIWDIDSKYNKGYPFLLWQGYARAVLPLGKGTSSDPYRIKTLYNLYWIAQHSDAWDKYFVQTSNIDASSTSRWNNSRGFLPIGKNFETEFTGSYDGKGYTIDSMYINRSSTNYIGLFGFVGSGAVIKNVKMLYVRMNGNNYVGGLVGYNLGDISRSYSEKGQVVGNNDVGGFIGFNYKGNISIAHSDGEVSGNSFVGGFVGYNYKGNIFISFSVGNVIGAGDVGGFVGYNEGVINNIYTTCPVVGDEYVGGLAGVNKEKISDSYSTSKVTGKESVGGLIGISDQGTVTSSFWDVETSGQKASAGGIGKTTLEMHKTMTFVHAGWDFIGGGNNIWNMDGVTNNGYPFFSDQTDGWTGNVSSDWFDTGNWLSGVVPVDSNTVSIGSTEKNMPVIAGETTAECFRLNIAQGAGLKVMSRSKLTVAGDLTNNGNLLLISDTTGNGSLIVRGHIEGKGTFVRQQEIINGGWTLLSSPSQEDTIVGSDFVPPLVGGIFPTDFDFYTFDESQSVTPWVNIRNDEGGVDSSFETSFIKGKGYLAHYTKAYGKTMFTFKGAFCSGKVQSPKFTFTPGESWSGWNLLGNPYTSSIDWSKANLDAFSDNFAYVYDEDKAGGPGYVPVDGSHSGAYISPDQGFFVKVSSAGHFTFSPAMQVHATSVVPSQPAEDRAHLTLRLNLGTHYDETIIRILGNAMNIKNTRDRTDALKLFSYDTAMPQLYSYTSDSVKVAVNTFPNIYSMNTVHLGLLIPKKGTYSISLQECTGNYLVMLQDRRTGVVVNLERLGNYTFTADKNDTDRFELKIISFGATGISTLQSDKKMLVYAYGREVYVRAVGKNTLTGEVTIENLFGQRVYHTLLSETTYQIIKPQLPTGMYIVQVKTDKGYVQTKKVFLR